MKKLLMLSIIGLMSTGMFASNTLEIKTIQAVVPTTCKVELKSETNTNELEDLRICVCAGANCGCGATLADAEKALALATQP